MTQRVRTHRSTSTAAAVATVGAALFALAGCIGTANINADVAVSITCDGDCLCGELDCSCDSSGTCSFNGDDGGALPSGSVILCELSNSCVVDCGDACNVKCAGASNCNVVADGDTTVDCMDSTLATSGPAPVHITCAGNSSCLGITAGPGSDITCAGNSTCQIECPDGGCDVTCTGSATCLLGCGSAQCGLSCEDGAPIQCADGRSGCPGEC